MGKKGVMLDNGRAAQSSMTLYWKKNKQKSRQPKEKVQHEEKQDEITDKRVMSNFQKWKMHKEKVITKAYTKTQQKGQVQKQLKNEKAIKQEQDLMEQLFEKKKPKIMTVPGFKSKHQLASRMQMQKPKQADQSTNILKLPSNMADLTQEQIVQMLRQRKSKQQMIKKSQMHMNNSQIRQTRLNQKQDVLLGDDYIDLIKNKQKELLQREKQELQKIEIQLAKSQPSFFKSQILNKIEKQGLQKGLQTLVPKVVENSQMNQTIKEQNQENQTKQQLIIQETAEPKKPYSINPKFLPRALKK